MYKPVKLYSVLGGIIILIVNQVSRLIVLVLILVLLIIHQIEQFVHLFICCLDCLRVFQHEGRRGVGVQRPIAVMFRPIVIKSSAFQHETVVICVESLLSRELTQDGLDDGEQVLEP